MENAGAPETGPAWDLPDVTVLFEVSRLHVIARRQAATRAVGVVVGSRPATEGAEARLVPDVQDISLVDVAKDLRLHLLRPAAGKTGVLVPEEVAGRYRAVLSHESPAVLYESATPLLLQQDLGKLQFHAELLGDSACGVKYACDLCALAMIVAQELFKVE